MELSYCARALGPLVFWWAPLLFWWAPAARAAPPPRPLKIVGVVVREGWDDGFLRGPRHLLLMSDGSHREIPAAASGPRRLNSGQTLPGGAQHAQ